MLLQTCLANVSVEVSQKWKEVRQIQSSLFSGPGRAQKGREATVANKGQKCQKGSDCSSGGGVDGGYQIDKEGISPTVNTSKPEQVINTLAVLKQMKRHYKEITDGIQRLIGNEILHDVQIAELDWEWQHQQLLWKGT